MKREMYDGANQENSNAAAWDMGDVSPFNQEGSKEEQEKEKPETRQKRKLIASFLGAVDGHIVGNGALESHDVNLPDGAREEVLDRINSGEITASLEKELLSKIATNAELKGPEGVLNSLTFEERYLAADLSSIGMDNWTKLTPGDISRARAWYPTAMDVESVVKDVVTKLASNFEAVPDYQQEVIDRFTVVAESLVEKIYGKQAQYLDEIHGLHAEAEAVKAEQEGYDMIETDRRQDKFMASILTAGNGELVNRDAIAEREVTLSDSAKAEAMDRLASGAISDAQKRAFMTSIQSPLMRDGSARVFSEFDDKHEYRILAWMSGLGFNNFQNTQPRDIDAVVYKFPSPMDFENAFKQLADSVRRDNGDEKGDQYLAAGDSLMRKVYGRQYDYWLEIKDLEAKAKERADELAKSGRQEASSVNRAEYEKSQEWQPGEVAFYQTSKNQYEYINRGNIEQGLRADGTCQDTLLSRPDKALFGVFDGVGGVVGGRKASQFAASSVERLSNEREIHSVHDLVDIMSATLDAYNRSDVSGATTATVGKLLRREDGIHLAYASVGDSRLYIVHENGTASLITKDEGYENAIFNCLGKESLYPDSIQGIKQFGEVLLKKGDRVVMCSDGITGDVGTDLMSNEELAGIVMRSRNAEDASKNLVANARKKDDRTAIVFGEF